MYLSQSNCIASRSPLCALPSTTQSQKSRKRPWRYVYASIYLSN